MKVHIALLRIEAEAEVESFSVKRRVLFQKFLHRRFTRNHIYELYVLSYVGTKSINS